MDDLRRRARHRLMGAVVLVTLGVVLFPVLFDTQPRPLPLDTPIEIPAKPPASNAASDTTPAAQAVPAPAPAASTVPDTTASPSPAAPDAAPPASPAAPASSTGAAVQVQDSLNRREEVLAAPTPPAAKPEPAKPEPSKPTPAPLKEPVPSTEAARVQALLDGVPAPATLRVVVQVGAFADPARAREVRQTLERAGLKTYTHVAETPDGPRTRVRLGPFASRTEAEQAAARVKALGLSAVLLTL
jgi:DedD protein